MFARQASVLVALVAIFVGVAGAFLGQAVDATLACVVVGAIAAILPPPIAFGLFVSAGVWKTAIVFGAPDSLLPTAALLAGWSASVALRNASRRRLSTAGRAAAILLPLTTWLFLSTFISRTGPDGYVEAFRFVAVVVLPSLLVALDITRGRLFIYAAAIFVSATLMSIAALASGAFAGTLWTEESLLFGANAVVFGRVAAMGFVAGVCLLPLTFRRRGYRALAYGGLVACATAVAHSTSRGAALAAIFCGLLAVVLLLFRRDRELGQRRGWVVFAAATAVVFLIVSATTFFPTGRGVQSLGAFSSEVPQFVQVPLLSQSLQTPSPRPSAGQTAPTLSQLPTPSAATTSPDPASVYVPDLALAYRVERYRIAVAQFVSSPVLGLGYTHGIYARDGQGYAHNIFLEVASELGLVGLACLAVLLIAVAVVLASGVSNWESAVVAVLAVCTFAMAQTSGNLTINRLFFVLSVAVIAHQSNLRSVSPFSRSAFAAFSRRGGDHSASQKSDKQSEAESELSEDPIVMTDIAH